MGNTAAGTTGDKTKKKGGFCHSLWGQYFPTTENDESVLYLFRQAITLELAISKDLELGHEQTCNVYSDPAVPALFPTRETHCQPV